MGLTRSPVGRAAERPEPVSQDSARRPVRRVSLEPVTSPPTPAAAATWIVTAGRYWHRLAPLVGLALFVAAVVVLARELRTMPPRELAATMRQVPTGALALAGLFTFLNYLILTGYDQLAFRYIRVPIGRARIALASFVGYAIANNVGFALLSGTSARYRFYSRWGLSGEDISRVVLFYSGTFWLGLLVVGGWALAGGELRALASMMPAQLAQATGWLLLATAFAYPVFAMLRRRPICVAGIEFAMPSPGLVTAQFVLSILDWALAAGVLYALLPGSRPDFLFFVGAFLAAQLVALVSHVPGGLGVFESLMILMLQMPAPDVLPALALFRVIYYLIPLALALLVLIGDELSQRRHQVLRWGSAFGALGAAVTPKLLAVFTMLASAVLLTSAALPAEPSRIDRLGTAVPLPVIETAHFLTGVLGAVLLVIAWGLWRRLAAAADWGLAALGTGAAAAILKGLDYEAAIVLAALAGALALSRSEFDRRTPLLDVPISPGWLITSLAVVSGFAGLGLFVFRHVAITADLWSEFGLHGDLPRFLRAAIGVGLVFVTVAVRHALRPTRPAMTLPDADELNRAAAVIAATPALPAPLALLGDKAFIWNEARDAFLMYAVHNSTWVALGDPVGTGGAGLVQAFLARCDEYDGLPVVCGASGRWLSAYAEHGLTAIRLGDEARVFLPHFSMEASGNRVRRTTLARLTRSGATLRVVPPEETAARLDTLREISDAWLAERGIRERSFAVSWFNPDYVRRFPAVLLETGTRIEAFALLWPDPARSIVTIDLLRHRAGAPRGFLDGLLTWVLTWARQQGYRWFSVGLVPVDEAADSETAPFWMRLGPYPFTQGGPYHYRLLRKHARKFDPVWEPRYLAYPGGSSLLTVLADVAALIARPPAASPTG